MVTERCLSSQRLEWPALGLALAMATLASPGALASTPDGPGAPSGPGGCVAFTHVTVLPMDRHIRLADRTVVVRDGRIAELGPASAVAIPPDARVVDSAGKYLLPSLVDAHMHLDALTGARPGFGDAPIYLAYGITSVFNLRGGPEDLETRRRIRQGELLAPNLYTSGEFVNEPRVNTSREARAEVATQARDGYDLLKIHQCVDPKTGRFTTTRGMSRETYRVLMEAARAAGIPILGHGPYNLGLDAVLDARQDLAHVGEFNPLYFLPAERMNLYLAPAGLGLVALLLALVALGLAAAWDRFRPGFRTALPVSFLTARRLVALLLAAGLAALLLFLGVMPGGRFTGSRALLVVLAALGLAFMGGAALLAWRSVRLWRERRVSVFSRVAVSVAAAGALAAAAVLPHWALLPWRATEDSIARVAGRCKSAGIWVQSTLVVYDGALEEAGARPLSERHPASRFLAPETRKDMEDWKGLPPPLAAAIAALPDFNGNVLRALHREGVPIMAGTDAMGVPWVFPGESLHRELHLMVRSGFTPFEALQAATVMPARYLRAESEFGTVSTGKRADLLLLDGDPLLDLDALAKPAGVMVRGAWLAREELEKNLRPLAAAR